LLMYLQYAGCILQHKIRLHDEFNPAGRAGFFLGETENCSPITIQLH
jgi:hypothetical protein